MRKLSTGSRLGQSADDPGPIIEEASIKRHRVMEYERRVMEYERKIEGD